jgi:hypothetical protein
MTAIIVGVLFIIAIGSGMLRYSLLDTILDAPDYLSIISVNETRVIIGTVSFLINAVALAGIAIVIYPILQKHNEALALGYVGARIVEAVLFIVAIISILVLFTLSQEFVNAGAPDISYFQTLGDLLLAVRHYAYRVVWPITLGLGTLIFYYLLYQLKLIPRWLSVWGFIGAILFPLSFGGGALVLPLVVNEWVLVVWLIVKGFNTSVINSESVN